LSLRNIIATQKFGLMGTLSYRTRSRRKLEL
jgi:hypothetical protein